MNHSSSRSGRRRRGSRRRPDHRNETRPSTSSSSLWQRILSFFKRNGSKPARPSPERPRPAASSAAAPASPRSAPKPEFVEVTTPRLYVGNLSFQATENDLTELFNGVGGVASAEVVTHRATERSKGFAFVQMNSVDEAKRAVRELHDQEFMGRKLVVSGAKVNDARDDSRYAA
jgi:RNA recognition motif-containing protein